MTSPHQPGRIQLRHVLTGSIRVVRFGSPEHHALKSERQPETHLPLYQQVDVLPTHQPQEGHQ